MDFEPNMLDSLLGAVLELWNSLPDAGFELWITIWLGLVALNVVFSAWTSIVRKLVARYRYGARRVPYTNAPRVKVKASLDDRSWYERRSR